MQRQSKKCWQHHKRPSDPNGFENVACRTVLILDILCRCLHNLMSLPKFSSAMFIRAPFQVRRLESALRNQ